MIEAEYTFVQIKNSLEKNSYFLFALITVEKQESDVFNIKAQNAAHLQDISRC